MHMQQMCHPSTCMCTDKWRPTVSTLCPLSLPHKKRAGGKSQLSTKQSSNGLFTENFLTIGGYFECYMYHVTALGCKQRRKKEDEQF